MSLRCSHKFKAFRCELPAGHTERYHQDSSARVGDGPFTWDDGDEDDGDRCGL